MQEDLEYCLKQFNDFMKLIDVDIQNGQVTREKIMMVEAFINIMLDIIKQTMVEALQEQKRKGE